MFDWFRESPKRILKRYVAAINARDVSTLARLSHPDIRFVDSRGDWIEGQEVVMQAVAKFFVLEKNFRIDARSYVLHRGDMLIQGSCSADDPRLALNTLWQARITDDRVSHWQAFGPGQAPALVHMLAPEATQRAT